MKLKLLFSTFLTLSVIISVKAQYNSSNSWNKTSKNALIGIEKIKKSEDSQISTAFLLELNTFIASLSTAPLRRNKSGKSTTIVSFPVSANKVEQFKVFEAPVMHPDLAARYPHIKSYIGYGLNTKGLTVRFSLSPQKGLSAMVTSIGNKTVFIEPYTTDLSAYLLFSRSSSDVRKKTFECLTSDIPKKETDASNKNANDQTLRTFRLAMSATGEYTAYHGGTKSDALAAINTTMTRVNGVYENDFAITMVLIANTDDVIYTDGTTDPYGGNLNNELQATLTSVITEASYDIGHLVHQETNSNGNAGCIGCVCVDGTKGSGFTSHVTPQGDFFDIDYVAHEMGHQFGANHTFTQGFGPEGTGAQMEPGSGSTIMGYAGITGASDVQAHSDDYFHFFTIHQITEYVASTGCQTTSPIVNAAPIADAGSDYTIPHSTAYILEGSATDANTANSLTYCWEQGDEGFGSKTSVSSTPNSGMSPSFRSIPPTASSIRYIPALISVVAGNLTTQWETVITQAGVMNIMLTVRDNVNNEGQNDRDTMVVTVDGASGPFAVTSQSTSITWQIGSTETITWDVANTTAAPVSTANVDIFLSLDGGLTYPITLATGVPNNGSSVITVPSSSATTTARVMVRGSGNIFYALNSIDFTINSPTSIAQFNEDIASIYPNPTTNKVTVDFGKHVKTLSYEVLSVEGRIVKQEKNIFDDKIIIDLSNESKGIYILKIETDSSSKSYKLIKE